MVTTSYTQAERRLLQKSKKRDLKKKPRMKVSGKSVFTLKKIQKQKGK